MDSGQRSSHPVAVVALLVAAALAGALAIGAIWANQQLLDTSSWVSVSGRLLQNGEVRHRVADFLAEELVAEAEGQLGEGEVAEEVLPQLRRRAPQLALAAMATPQFRAIWLQANRTAHRQLLRVLDEEATNGNGNGGVVVNLTPALRELADSIDESELAEAFGIEELGSLVEPGAARIEVLEAEELEEAQDVVRTIRDLPLPATLATVALLVLALLLGRARLRRTFAGVGLSLAAAGALALVARSIAGEQIIDRLLSRETDREAAEAAWHVATSTVTDLATTAIVLGGLTVLAAAVGPAVWAFLRRTIVDG